MSEDNSFWIALMMLAITFIVGLIFWINTLNSIWVLISCGTTIATLISIVVLLSANREGEDEN